MNFFFFVFIKNVLSFSLTIAAICVPRQKLFNIIKGFTDGGEITQKDEIIQFHTFLLQLRKHLEKTTDHHHPYAFLSYDTLRIGPHKIHKSKKEHKKAVFELSKGIAGLLQENNCSIFQETYDGLERICTRCRK